MKFLFSLVRASILCWLIVGMVLLSRGVQAQNSVNWDNTGNILLSGTYNYREILWLTDQNGSNTLQEASVQYGTITFDGNGTYSVAGTIRRSGNTSSQNLSFTGTYTIAASGLGFINRADSNGGILNGMVANGVFVGSSTESVLNNLFIAARATATTTTSSFTQAYSAGYLNLPAVDMTQIRNASLSLQPNGTGGVASISASGRIGGSAVTVTQTIAGATYSFANGIGTLNLGGSASSTTLATGSMQLYVSPDGGLIFGGSLTNWDMFVAIRTPSASVTTSTIDGLFYTAAMEVNKRALPSGLAVLDSYYGASKTFSGTAIGHQRILQAPDSDPFDYTYSDTLAPSSSGVYLDLFGYRNYATSDGKYRIGVGEGSFLGLNVAIRAPELSGAGVFINPTGIVHAASFAPFTVGISPGELFTLFGTNLATTTALDSTFPSILGGTQVTVNGKVAPIYFVSPGQLSAVVPFDVQGAVAEIQVSRGGTLSNRVTVFRSATTPGIFTVPATGVGIAAARHNADGSLVNEQNPAVPGEYVQIYATGLGTTSPVVTAGKPGPSNPVSRSDLPALVYVDGQSAVVQFAGLAPFFGGLYQLNVQIPSQASAGNVLVEVSTPGALNSQVTMPVVTKSSDVPSSGSTPSPEFSVRWADQPQTGTGPITDRKRPTKGPSTRREITH
ncbi:MAG: hypothetical protein ABI824_11515 [Acidobacteriota bacterium]